MDNARDIIELAKAYDAILRNCGGVACFHHEAKKAIEKCIWYAMQHAGWKELASWNKENDNN